jgi:hypothetical protein
MAKVTAQVLGGEVKVLEDVDTVGEVKDLMGVSSHTATVNGEPAEDDDALMDFEFVSLSPSVKGG